MVEPERTVVKFGPVIVIRRGANELRYYQGAKLVRKFGVATGPGDLSDADRDVRDRGHAAQSLVAPTGLGLGARGSKPIPPGPGNPLGTRWMGLTAPGVGIHGTPDDASIGYSASHGCIRMHIPDAEWVFNHVELGTPVVITDA